MTIRIQLVLLFSLLATSCATINIKEASRTTVYPGVRDAKIYVNYEVLISSKKEVEVKEIFLGNKQIDTFFTQNMKTQVFESKKKIKGLYKILFKLPKSSEANKNDILELRIVQEEKIKTLTTPITTKKAIHRR